MSVSATKCDDHGNGRVEGLKEFFDFMRTDEQFYYPNTDEGKEATLNERWRDRRYEGTARHLVHRQPEADLIVKRVVL